MARTSTSQVTSQTLLFQVCTQLNTHRREDTETGKQPKKECNQEFCELKENLSSLQSCWNKFEKVISRWFQVNPALLFPSGITSVPAFDVHPPSNSAHVEQHFVPGLCWKATVPCSWRQNKQKRLEEAAEVQEVEIKDQHLKQKNAAEGFVPPSWSGYYMGVVWSFECLYM